MNFSEEVVHHSLPKMICAMFEKDGFNFYFIIIIIDVPLSVCMGI
jgi:hypothetical protein